MLRDGVTWAQFWNLFNWDHVLIMTWSWLLGIWTVKVKQLFFK